MPGPDPSGTPSTNTGSTGILGDIIRALGGGGDLAKILPGLLGLGAQGVGTYLNQANLDRAFNYVNGIGNNTQDRSNASYGQGGTVLDQQKWGLNDLLSGQNPWMQNLMRLAGTSNDLQGQIPGMIGDQNNNLIYQDPNMQAALRAISGLMGSSQGIQSKAAELLNSGGMTNSQIPLGDFATSLMSGSTPNQRGLSSAGLSALNSGGMTPELQQALAQASGIVSAGGATPLTNALAQRGLDLAKDNPLISKAQAMSIAQDQTGRQYANAARTARGQAEARGQGPGSVTASGAGNDALADFSDQALSGQSTAVQNALMGQQSLGLQQLAQGLNTGLSAADIQRTLQLGGLGSVGNLVNSSTGRLGTGGQLAMDSSNLANSGAGFYNALLGLQQGNMKQGFDAGMTSIGQQEGIGQTALQDLLQGRTGAAGLGSTLANLLMQNIGQQGSLTGQGLNTTLSGLGQYGQQGSTWLGNSSSALGDYAGTGNAIANLSKTPNQWSVFLNNLGAAAQGRPGVSISPNINFNPSIGGGGGGGDLFSGLNGFGGGGYNPFGSYGDFSGWGMQFGQDSGSGGAGNGTASNNGTNSPYYSLTYGNGDEGFDSSYEG